MNAVSRFIPLIVTLGGTLGAFFFTPAFVAAHPVVFVAVNAVAQVLHAVLPSVFGSSTPTS